MTMLITFFVAMRAFLSAFGDAIAAGSAVDSGRRPAAHNLRGLGIDPEQFRNIKF